MQAESAMDLWPDLVFRESEYYEAIGSPNKFVNHTPQSYFQRHNVVFIGTSLEDLNIRRWLYSSFRERVEQRDKVPEGAISKPIRGCRARGEARIQTAFLASCEGGC